MKKIIIVVLVFVLLVGAANKIEHYIVSSGDDTYIRIINDTDTLKLGIIDGVFTWSGNLTVTGDITSNVIRGQLYDSTANTTSIGVSDTYYTINGLIDTLSNGVTVTDSSMTLTEPGVYLYILSASYTYGTNNTGVHISLFINGVDFVPFEGERKIATGGDFGFSGGSGVYVSDGTEVLKLRTRCTNTGTLTINHINFTFIKIG